MGGNSPRVCIVCPAPAGTRLGNRITALRWQAILKSLGCRPHIVVGDAFNPDDHHDLVIALHAKRNAAAIAAARASGASVPIVLAITGTDLYRDGKSPRTKRSIEIADRIVVLQPEAGKRIPKHHQKKVRVIYQSVTASRYPRALKPRQLRVIVAGHLRREKDPLRAAFAMRRLPAESRIVVRHYGGVLDAALGDKAVDESRRNCRYEYRGECTRSHVRRELARSWMMVISSRLEGGANVLSEAIVDHLPVLASRIDGNIGLLGEDYSGYFRVGDTHELRRLLIECEMNSDFIVHLKQQVLQRAPLFHPDHEHRCWANLLKELDL